MLISKKWLSEFVKLPDGVSDRDLASKLSLSTVEVEKVIDQAADMDKMVLGLVVACAVHPNADRLKICSVDVGNRMIQVVCGGTNVAQGMKVAVALSGSKVRWHGEGDLVELSNTKIRGEKSEGMICAGIEIGIEKSGEGEHEIMDLSALPDAPGTPLAKALGRDDDQGNMGLEQVAVHPVPERADRDLPEGLAVVSEHHHDRPVEVDAVEEALHLLVHVGDLGEVVVVQLGEVIAPAGRVCSRADQGCEALQRAVPGPEVLRLSRLGPAVAKALGRRVGRVGVEVVREEEDRLSRLVPGQRSDRPIGHALGLRLVALGPLLAEGLVPEPKALIDVHRSAERAGSQHADGVVPRGREPLCQRLDICTQRVAISHDLRAMRIEAREHRRVGGEGARRRRERPGVAGAS